MSGDSAAREGRNPSELAVHVSEHLGSPRQAQESGYGFDDEQDEYVGDDARRAWASPPSRPPQRPWDRYPD